MFSRTLTNDDGRGIVLTSNARTVERLLLLRTHGQRRDHEHVIGSCGRGLAEIQAAIGFKQPRKLEPILSDPGAQRGIR